jgi:Glucanosyltransferase
MNMSVSHDSLERMSITMEDRIVIRGRHFVYERNPSQRFHMRGMAFPVPLHYQDPTNHYPYHPEGWISILKQLREATPYLNTIRLYRLPPTLLSKEHGEVDDDFFRAAAKLGFYVLVPLTDASGSGVLDRDLVAPKCYPQRLFRYGTQVLDALQKYPNILGAVIGNEVMNSLPHWHSAPCLLAYARDLKRHFGNSGDDSRMPPLIYTAQHDGIGASVSPAQQIQLTTNFLTCSSSGATFTEEQSSQDGSENNNDNSNTTMVLPHAIDAIGINIESWCSSLQTYDSNEDGSLGTFKDLYQHLEDAAIVPIFFSELGCSQLLFDRDNGLRSPENALSNPTMSARTWKELSVIEGDMADVWSGYIAYTYDGPSGFRMTEGGPWDGTNMTLPFNADMDNFVKQLETVATKTDEDNESGGNATSSTQFFVSCDVAREAMKDCCSLDLVSLEKMPSYAQPNFFTELKNWIEHFLPGLSKNGNAEVSNTPAPMASMMPTEYILGALLVVLCGALMIWKIGRNHGHRKNPRVGESTETINTSHAPNYDTFDHNV